MYNVKPNLIIGFHGCERSVRDLLLMNPNDYKISQKPFDWLGHGLYFWENNYDRALEWATDKKQRGKIAEPAVIGAVLSLGKAIFKSASAIRTVFRDFSCQELRSTF